MARVRYASPNEQRAISRENLGFYNALAVGAIYEFLDSSIDVRSSRSFHGALRRCIAKYPTLGVVVRDMHTDKAYFERVSKLNLDEHIAIIDEAESDAKLSKEDGADELQKIERLLPSILDRPWPASPPPWRVVVVPLSSSDREGHEVRRCFVAFSFSHALGDGIIALEFHRTFRDAIFDGFGKESEMVATSTAHFPAPFDTKKNFPITWGFLLGPLIAVLLPKFLAELLGLRATTSAVNSGTWIGRRMFYEQEAFYTKLRLIEFSGFEVANMLRVAKNHEARLTAVIHQSVVRALSKMIPASKTTNFVSGTAVNMRKSVGISDRQMGLFVNAWYQFHDRDDVQATPWSKEAWASAKTLTQKLAECAVSLKDQPLGLLRYVPSITKWTAGKIGQERDCSYEVSNLGAFEAPALSGPEGGEQCIITKMIFTRPANANAAPLDISVVSVKGGNMVIAFSWQPGALGMPLEDTFVKGLCASVKQDLENLS